jgi:hypothetical protein
VNVVSTCAVIAVLSTAGYASESTTRWAEPLGEGWLRHTIDNTSLGADGVRLGDINGDGLPDITTPWEQGGKVMVYINPGKSKVKEQWPRVVVGQVGDPEDAVFVDLDGDGVLDVVSACEGETRTMFIHWAPSDKRRLMDSSAWTTAPLGDSAGRTRWMFSVPLQVDGIGGIDLVAGSRGTGAGIGWFQSPSNPRNAAEWKWHPLYQGGWMMTLRAHDIDGDGDRDVVASDRTGSRRGVLWLENPYTANGTATKWIEHRIGAVNEYEAMHHTIADFDRDGLDDVIVAVKGGPIRYHRRVRQTPAEWRTQLIEMPTNTGSGKAVEVADINSDGRLDLVVTCEHAIDGKVGVFWLSYDQDAGGSRWVARSVNGGEGFIFDLLQLVDVDVAIRVDVITLEEKGPYLASGYVGRELGVVWYENPTR